MSSRSLLCFFFFNDTATTEIYTLSLHDALPISTCTTASTAYRLTTRLHTLCWRDRKSGSAGMPRPISYAVFCLKKNKAPKHTRTCPINLSLTHDLPHLLTTTL